MKAGRSHENCASKPMIYWWQRTDRLLGEVMTYSKMLFVAFKGLRSKRTFAKVGKSISVCLDAIENNHVLTLSREYFFLRKPLERRLYELARKHCGSQKEWRISLDSLREKCGSGSTLKEFRRLVSKIIEDDGKHDHMPDYVFSFDGDLLKVRQKKIVDQASLPLFSASLGLSGEIYEKARTAAPGWDIHGLEEEWRVWVLDKGITVSDADAHFLSFCRKRGRYQGR